MPRYLDPKTDIVFKKIFGEHPELLKSFLNAVLPLPSDGLIKELEYLSGEQVPLIPSFKYTVVDVRCTDQQGRVFIVEMQIQWTTSFQQRMLFNASKAYVTQLQKGENYELLRPVYGLGLVNTIFDPNNESGYHHYKMVNVMKPHESEIKDLQLVFIELPKFKTDKLSQQEQKKLQILWLHFMAELNEKSQQVPEEWSTVPEIKQALDLAQEAAYTPNELLVYDQYWDAISIEKTLVGDAHKEGEAKGREEGLAEGEMKGLERGRAEGALKAQQLMARNLLAKGFSHEQVADLTGLPLSEINKLLQG